MSEAGILIPYLAAQAEAARPQDRAYSALPLATDAKDHTRIAGAALAATDLALMTGIAITLTPAQATAVCLTLLPLLAIYAQLNLYPGFGMMAHARLRRRWLTGTLWLAGVSAGISLATETMPWPLLASGILFLALSPLAEGATRHLLHKNKRWGRPVVLLGPEQDAAAVITDLIQNLQLGFVPAMLNRLQMTPPLPIVLVAGAHLPADLPHGCPLYLLRTGGCLQSVHDEPRWLPVPAQPNPTSRTSRMAKRLLDIAAALALLPVALPIVAICAAIIYAADPGHVIYSQIRHGRHGRPVKIWKLRSMYHNSQQMLEKLLASDPAAASEWYARFKLARDPRIIRGIGHFIRRYSIDELPQLWNVLRGDISLIGPRVFVDYDLKAYTPQELALRDSVKPGLTGLWQVAVRSDGPNRAKVIYDLAYIRNWSLWLDLSILLRTIGAVLSGRGAA